MANCGSRISILLTLSRYFIRNTGEISAAELITSSWRVPMMDSNPTPYFLITSLILPFNPDQAKYPASFEFGFILTDPLEFRFLPGSFTFNHNNWKSATPYQLFSLTGALLPAPFFITTLAPSQR